MKYKVWMAVAHQIATLTTCPRRAVGCVILSDLGHVLATGFNGVPSGMTSCFVEDCGASSALTGDSLAECFAVHAEMNALMQLRTPREASEIIVTSSPCRHCLKMLLNTEIHRIVYDEVYDAEVLHLWEATGRASCHASLA